MECEKKERDCCKYLNITFPQWQNFLLINILKALNFSNKKGTKAVYFLELVLKLTVWKY